MKGGRRHLKKSEHAEIVRLYEADVKFEAICDQFDVHSSTLTYVLKKAGVRMRGRGYRRVKARA